MYFFFILFILFSLVSHFFPKCFYFPYLFHYLTILFLLLSFFRLFLTFFFFQFQIYSNTFIWFILFLFALILFDLHWSRGLLRGQKMLLCGWLGIYLFLVYDRKTKYLKCSFMAHYAAFPLEQLNSWTAHRVGHTHYSKNKGNILKRLVWTRCMETSKKGAQWCLFNANAQSTEML